MPPPTPAAAAVDDDDDDGDDVGGGAFRNGTELISDRSQTMDPTFFSSRKHIRDLCQNKHDNIRNRMRAYTHNNTIS